MTTMLSLLVSGNMAMPVSAEETINNLLGDVNVDGEFNICDVVMLQKWISGKDNLSCWQNADFTGDGIVNIFDLCCMKKELISNIKAETYPVENPVVIIDEFKPCTATLDEYFDYWHIYVMIKHQYSVPGRVWTVEDFQGIEGIHSIHQFEEESPYRQGLEIGLKTHAHEQENVLKLMHDIENRLI